MYSMGVHKHWWQSLAIVLSSLCAGVLCFSGAGGCFLWGRDKEHKYGFDNNYHTSNYAKHISEQTHSFGPIHDTMQILQYQNKGSHLNTIARFYIYSEGAK